MINTDYLFSQKWKIGLAIIAVILVSFLDTIIPPFGVPLALLVIFIIYRWKKLPIKSLGFYKPKSWLKIVLIGLIVGIFYQIFDTFVLASVYEWLGFGVVDLSGYDSIVGNNSMLLLFLIVSWTTAGLGEELIYRSFLLEHIGVFFEDSKAKELISLSISSILFGLLHFPQGIVGIISTGIAGFIFGLVYLKTNRNIWAAYFAHAITDTVGVLIIYSGLYKLL
jgi:membrane protease YdiL (CAAX protease family)